jgi:hypothetical protein
MKLEIDTAKLANRFRAFHYKESTIGRALMFFGLLSLVLLFLAPFFAHVVAMTFGVGITADGPLAVYWTTVVLGAIVSAIVALADAGI